MELREPKRLRVETKFDWQLSKLGVIELTYKGWSGYTRDEEQHGGVRDPAYPKVTIDYAFQPLAQSEFSDPSSSTRHNLQLSQTPFPGIRHQLNSPPLIYSADTFTPPPQEIFKG